MMHELLLIGVISIVTILTRALPFLIFKDKKSKVIAYLGEVLPYSVMAMLVVYGLKDVQVWSGYHGLCELIGVMSVVFFHLLKRNILISIFGGTIIYMLCVQVFFI